MDDDSVIGGEKGCRQSRRLLRRTGRSEREGAHGGPPRELYFEVVPAGGRCVYERLLGGATKDRSIGALAGQEPFCLTGSPRLHGHSAKREARVRNRSVLDAQSRRRRDNRERIGGAFAHLQ